MELSKVIRDHAATMPDEQWYARSLLRMAADGLDATSVRNQCDGCARGLPVNANGNHYDGEHPVMGCTKERYLRSAGDHS